MEEPFLYFYICLKNVYCLCPFQIAAFIAEPVMGAGGVILPPKTYFEKVICNSM